MCVSSPEKQLIVPGGVWKSTELVVEGPGDWGLLGEAVSPGFDYCDMTIGDEEMLRKENLPEDEWEEAIAPFLKPKSVK